MGGVILEGMRKAAVWGGGGAGGAVFVTGRGRTEGIGEGRDREGQYLFWVRWRIGSAGISEGREREERYW